MEEALSLKFNIVVAKMGFRDTQWGRLAIIMFSIWCLATCFVCFQKADFLNVSTSCKSFETLVDYLFLIMSYRTIYLRKYL